MPLFKSITHNSNTQIYIWKITESTEELLLNVHLNDSSKKRLATMKSESHIKGFLAVRKLLEHCQLSDEDLYYNDVGKPLLKNGTHITISHSFDFSVIGLSNSIIGIDIEQNRDKIIRIARKFIDKESAYLTQNKLIEQLTVIWGAKESLFKIHPKGGLLFREHLPIDPFKLSDSKTKGHILKDNLNEHYNIYFDIFEGYTLVYATNEKRDEQKYLQ